MIFNGKFKLETTKADFGGFLRAKLILTDKSLQFSYSAADTDNLSARLCRLCTDINMQRYSGGSFTEHIKEYLS